MNPETFRALLKFMEKFVKDEDYQCMYCLEPFENTDLLKKHSITEHMNKRFVCDFCLKDYKTASGLISHIRQNHMYIPMPKKNNLKRKNYEYQTKEVDYEPESESESEDSEYDQYNDEGRKNKKPVVKYPRKCDHCDYEVPERRVHYHHYLFMHKDIIDEYPFKETNRIPCSFCGVFKSFRHIANHEIKHSGEKFKCIFCPKTFSSHANMTKHKRNVHTKSRMICDFCLKGFKTRLEITRHIRIHTGEKPYKCHICGAGFAHSGNRQIHILSAHQNVKQVPKKTNSRNNQKKSQKKNKGKKKPRRRASKNRKVHVQRNKNVRVQPKKKVKTVDSDSDSDDEKLSVIQQKKQVAAAKKGN